MIDQTKNITLSPVLSPEDDRRFWQAADAMLLNDVLPSQDLGSPLSEEEVEHLRSKEYRDLLRARCERETDRARRAFFTLDGQDIGFCFYCTYRSEDGKCLVVDFCVFPEYRCRGLGARCFEALKAEAWQEGAEYFALNTHCRRAMKFWERLGFVYNGYDAHGSIALILPPADEEVACEALKKADFWQLLDLENAYKAEIGENFLLSSQQEALLQAAEEGRIRFYAAKRRTRVVAMCSVSEIFSTFRCGKSGIFEDFFVEPAFRKKGYARKLTEFVRRDCAARGVDSLLVGCAECDGEMYRSLGFTATLGTLLSADTAL